MKKPKYSCILAITDISCYNMADNIQFLGTLTACLGMLAVSIGKVMECHTFSKNKIFYNDNDAEKEINKVLEKSHQQI